VKTALCLASLLSVGIAGAQVLSERTQDLGYGFRLVARSQANPPGHWEGIGHFSFLYYRDSQLCQCGHIDFSIAPSGDYAIYAGSEKVMLFNRATQARTVVSRPEFVGSIEKVEWSESSGTAKVSFYQNIPGHKNVAPVTVRLK
jgi:hypothetical protein